MSFPREVLPGRFYMVTRRCSQRQFFLRPDRSTNDTLLYCLAVAVQRSRVELVHTTILSNHHHSVVFDRHGTISEFMEQFHGLAARSVNALRGRRENLWSSEPPCLVGLIDREDVLAKIVYAATNPVKDHLVERVHQWPGVSTLSALLNDRPIVVHRPRHFFRENGPLPETVTLAPVIPPELGDPATVRRELRDRISAVEHNLAADRRATGRRVLGRRAVLRQSWRDRPSSHEPRRGLRPRVAARNTWARVEALRRNRIFVSSYREALLRWRAGFAAVFPAGTYWLRRFANVTVAPATPA